MKLSDKTKYKILYVDSHNEQLTFVFDDRISTKILKDTNLEPRPYDLPKNLTKDLKGDPRKLELSKTGTYIFAAKGNMICLYKSD